MRLSGKQIVVGVGGGIAAFKAVALVRELQRRGASVRVVMTRSATRFIGPMTFSGLTGTPAVVDLWDPAYPGEVHVELSMWAHAVVVAPATANLLARAATGMADDAVLACLSCATGRPLLFAPAMHERMWLAPATQRNVRQLEQDGATLVGPVQGALASGEQGGGRMAEPEAIAAALEELLCPERDLAGRTLLVSAGPTQEDLDPVRFISNRSSGRMGFALAAAARDRGAHVIAVCGPTSVAPPAGIELVTVRSALEMQQAVQSALPRADAVIMTAAVADYRARTPSDSKLKKRGEVLTLELIRNPDILAEVGAARAGKRPVLVGFAMETHDVVASARRKLVAKKCDLVVANEAAVGFGRDDTQATLVAPEGDEPLPPMRKRELADRILDRIVGLIG
jgi:phosphopantothenoylcysteine decarboxylase / phosphopantothenate---cysteine ligase